MTSSKPPQGTDRSFLVFLCGTAAGIVHALDDAVLNRQPGVPVDQHLPALAAVLVAALAAVWYFRRAGTGARAALALVVGTVTAVNGGMHVMHIAVSGDVSGSDVTGVAAAAIAVVLLGMSALLPFLHRGERRATRRRTWTVRVLVTATVAGVAMFVLLPVGVGIGQTHLYRSPVGEPPDGRFESVTFTSADGLELSGWYAPSENRAAVVMVSGARGHRSGTVDHAVLMADHGFGVLLYDARGTGHSEGTPNGYGWGWERDVAGALDFLGDRPDVDPSRIGGLGLSTGADVLIEVAATDRRLAAVVADGATIRSMSDIPADQPGDFVLMGPVLATVQLLSGESPGAPLVDLVADVSPTPLLLVAAGSIGPEIKVNRLYAEASGPTTELWTLPAARHTAAIRDEAAEYERRVVAHFEDAL
jgi:alpha/beta superfamily hydrolase